MQRAWVWSLVEELRSHKMQLSLHATATEAWAPQWRPSTAKKKRRRIRKTWIQIWTIQPWHIIWTSYWKSLTLCLLFGKMGITIPVLWMLLKNWINMCKLYVCVLSSHSVVSDSLQPMDCSPPGSSVYGILQARTLKWVATSSSRRSSRPRDWIHVSCTGRWALHCWATREARILHHCAVMMSPGQLGEKEKSRGFVPKWKIVSISKIFCRLTVTFKAGVLWNILKFWFCHINQMINSWGSWMKLWALQKVKRRHLCRKRDNKKAMGAEPYRMSKWETEKAREETAIHRGISQCVCMYVRETERDRERERAEKEQGEERCSHALGTQWGPALHSLPYIWPCCASSPSHVQLSATTWTVACQVPLSTRTLQARILEWDAMPTSRGSFQPRDQTQVTHIAGGFFTIWATRKAQEYWSE